MAIKRNMNEQNSEKKERGKWQISLVIENQKEACLIAEAENLSQPNDSFEDYYPVVVSMPSLYTYFQMLKKVCKFSSMGIFSRVSKVG